MSRKTKDGLHVELGATILTNNGYLSPYLANSTLEMAKESLPDRTVFSYEKMESLGGKAVSVLLIEIGSEEEMIEAVKVFCRGMGE